MLKKIKIMQALHEAFFENSQDNKVTMGIGFAASAFSILVVIGLYQL